MQWQELVDTIDRRLPIGQDHTELAKSINLEALQECLPFGSVDCVRLSPIQRNVVFHGTREKDSSVFLRGGFFANPDYECFTHDIRTATNMKWCDGLITVWNPPPALLTPGDRSSFGIVNPIPESFVGQRVEETEGRYAFTVGKNMQWLSSDYLLAVLALDHARVRRSLTAVNSDYLRSFTGFNLMVETLTQLIMSEGQPLEVYHNPNDKLLSLADIAVAAAVKLYESQLKQEATLIQMGMHLREFDRMPDFDIGPYQAYKKIKGILTQH